MLEEVMKARLVDWLLSNDKYQTICSELIFFEGKRRADIVTISECLSVYEIKGDHDNLSNIVSQIKDYQLCFDYVFVVTTKKHSSKLTKLLPRSIGIICIFEDNQAAIIRKASKRKRLNKTLLTSLLPRNIVVSSLRAKMPQSKLPIRSSVTDLRKHLAKLLNQDEIHMLAVDYLKSKHARNYCAFLRERGHITHPDDLLLLTSKPIELSHKDPLKLD